MIQERLTFVLIGLLLCSWVSAQDGVRDDSDLPNGGAISKDTREGQFVRVLVDEFNPVTQRMVRAEVVAPLFDPAVVSVPEGRIKFDVDILEDMHKLIMRIAEDTMIKQKWSAQMVHYAVDVKRVLSDMGKKLTELPAESKGPPIKREYVEMLHDMWHEIQGSKVTAADKLNRPEEEKRKNTLEERREFVNQMDDLFFILSRFVAQSPVGIYVKWNKLTINGEVLPMVGNSKVRFFKRNGYATTMNVLNLAIRATKALMLNSLGFKA